MLLSTLATGFSAWGAAHLIATAHPIAGGVLALLAALTAGIGIHATVKGV